MSANSEVYSQEQGPGKY